MSEMIVQVRNKMLRRIGGVNHFVSHNKDYTIQFQFDESWDNVRTKMAVFAYEDGEYGSEIFDGDTCNVPELPREGRILIGVKAGEDLSTELLCIPVCKSADDVITDEYDEPDPKIYEQILDIINNLWNGGTTVYPSPVRFLAAPSAAKVGDLIRVKEVDENGDVTRTEGFDVGVELEKKIDAPQVAQVGEVLTVEEVDAEGKPKKWKTARGVNITTELTQESTDTQVPSAKAAYDAIQNATDKDAVRFVAQKLTDTQKQQARENILAFGFTQLCDDSIEGWHDSADTKYKQALGLDTARGDFPIYITRVGRLSSFSAYMGYTLDGKYVMFYRYSDGSLSTTSPTYKNVVFIELTNSDGQWLSTTPFNIIQDYYNIKSIIYGVAEGCLLPLIYLDDKGCVFLGHTPNYSTVRVMVNNKSAISTSALFDKLSVVIASTTINGVTSYTADKNFSEVLSACKDGATVVINYDNIIIPMVDFSDSQISFMISLYGFATIDVFLREGDNDVCNVTLYRSPYYEFSAVYVNFVDGESEGLLDADYTYNELFDEIDYSRNIYGYYQDRELKLTEYPSPEDGDLAYFSFTGVNPVDDKVYFERIDYKQDGTITYQKKEVCTDIDVMTGATSTEGGSSGLVPAPAQNDSLVSKFLNDRGVWEEPFPLYSWYNLSLLLNTGTNLPRSIIITQSYNNPVSGVPEDRFGLLVFTNTNREYLKYIMFGSSGKIYDVEYNRGTERYYYYESKYSLPTVSTSDNNKILQVSNGVWTASDFPTASPTALGGVKPIAKTDSMTQEVGIDAEGKLYTKPSSSSGGSISFEQDGDYILIISTGVTIIEENGYITIS